MRKYVSGIVTALVALAEMGATAGDIRHRLVYGECYLRNDVKMNRLFDLVPRAAASGYTGLVLQGDLQSLWLQGEEQKARLLRLKKACDEVGIEIIPAVWSIGYGTMLGVDPNLAEGMPCRDIPYVVSADGRKAVHEPEPPLPPDFDAGFENPRRDGRGGFVLDGFKFTEKPGEISFIDTEIKHSGRSSIRFDCAATDAGNRHARALLHLKVRPYSRYNITMWFKTENVKPKWSVEAVFYTVPQKGEVNGMTRTLSFTRPPIDSDGNCPWTKVDANLSTLQYDEVQLWFGSWLSPHGHVWVDDIEVRRAGLPDVLRRPGCPFEVRGAENGETYVEGRDFDPVPPAGEGQRKAARENGSLVLSIPAGSRIRPGERLLVNGYRAHYMKAGYQVCTCMSEPKLYELMELSARSLADMLHPKTWFLPEDEIRQAGQCAACERRKIGMPDMFADCVRRMCATIRKVSPGARIYMWGDQLDPNMNGKGLNYLCRGSFAGSIDKVPKDLVIMHWGGKVPESLAYFGAHGFETARSIADFDGPWTDRMDEIARRNVRNVLDDPRCHTIMFTTWNGDYRNVERFASYLPAAKGDEK